MQQAERWAVLVMAVQIAVILASGVTLAALVVGGWRW